MPMMNFSTKTPGRLEEEIEALRMSPMLFTF